MLAAGLVALLGMGGAAPKKPVYVGARACGQCHDGAGMGNQYSKWLTTKHSKAYAVLSLPESVEITKRSGLRGQPWKEPICLGCHSTASTAEDWEKDDAFRPEDGLQCESCHGPGSEYMSEEVMRNRAEAMKAGLRLPNEDTCLGCHMEKGSHTAVNPNSTVDIKQAIPRIAHPLMKPSQLRAAPAPRAAISSAHRRAARATRVRSPAINGTCGGAAIMRGPGLCCRRRMGGGSRMR